VEFIAQKYGDQSLFKIMECLGEQQTMDQALRQTLGIDMNTFEQEFVQFIRQNY
jgi:hypothetical protein